MKRILMILMIVLAVVSVSAVSAADNATEIVKDDFDSQLEADESSDNVVLANDSEEPVNKTPSKITSSSVSGYDSSEVTISCTLSSDNKPLASKPVTIMLNGKNYTKTTDAKGKATLSVSLKTGSYTAQFFYAGDNSTQNATASSKVTIKAPTKTKLKLGDKYLNYRQGSKCLFYVKLVTSSGKAIANHEVIFKVAGKTYKAKTTKYGNAKIYLKLKKGTYKVKYAFKRSPHYLASSGSAKIKVRAKMPKGDGYWLWPMHMKSVNLKSLSKKGTKHIFLHVQALSTHGKKFVVSFIKKAHRYKMKVHLWMQICYSGGKWAYPDNGHGALKHSFINKKVKQAVYFAKIKGVDGVHFDYMRYGGTAHKHKNAVESINYIVKKAAVKIHNARPNCIVSGALMPEPSAMHYYYGQDVPTLSRYLDALIPMVYKGNYHQSRSWIKSVTSTFVKQSNGAQIWTGLQSYVSDSNTKKLSHSTLLKDAKAAKKGGALGIVLFRIGISCNFNFKKV